MDNFASLKSRREFIKALLAGPAAALIGGGRLTDARIIDAATRASSAAPTGWAQVPRILQRIKPPVFPKRDFIITRFGAISDGKTDCSEAFRRAIAECNKAGGGRVVVPAGVFLTGAIHLKSNVNLHVGSGATIAFSPDTKHYLPVVFTRWEGVELMNYSPFIYAFAQQNIAITGTGTLDGQSDTRHWWPWNGRDAYGWQAGAPNQRNDRNALLDMAERGIPARDRLFGEGHY